MIRCYTMRDIVLSDVTYLGQESDSFTSRHSTKKDGYGNSEKIKTLNHVYLTNSYISTVHSIFRPCTSILN
jgi:hypothetical protein